MGQAAGYGSFDHTCQEARRDSHSDSCQGMRICSARPSKSPVFRESNFISPQSLGRCPHIVRSSFSCPASLILLQAVYVAQTKWCGVNRNSSHHRVLEAFEESLAKLDCGYIDMYLMHWPQAVVDGTARICLLYHT